MQAAENQHTHLRAAGSKQQTEPSAEGGEGEAEPGLKSDEPGCAQTIGKHAASRRAAVLLRGRAPFVSPAPEVFPKRFLCQAYVFSSPETKKDETQHLVKSLKYNESNEILKIMAAARETG